MIAKIIGILLVSFPASAECFSVQDLKNKVCWAMCRNDGFDTGLYVQKDDSCVCGQKRSYKDLTDKVIKISPRRPNAEDFN